MKKIFCFGNEYIEGDQVAKVLAMKIGQYKDFEFIVAESPNEILNATEDLWILDVMKGGLPSVKLTQNPEKLEIPHSLTCHDLDLGFYLKLMTETGKIKNVNIIGIPFGEKDIEKIEKEVLEILDKALE